MKTMALLMLSVMVVSSGAFAGVYFQGNSKLPKDVQNVIEKSVEKNCPQISALKWRVQELETRTRVNRVDQGLTDTYFMSRFEVHAKELDSNHSRRYPLNIESVTTQANNGYHISVTILEGCN